MKNKFKKLVTCLILGVFAMNGASAIASPTRTPEFALLESLISASGQFDAKTQAGAALLQQNTDSAITQYLENPTANPDDAVQNFRDALVTMNIYSPSQAEQLLRDAQSGVQVALTKEGASNEEMSKALTTELLAVSRMNPVGAQFSGCNMGDVMMGVGVLGLAGAGVTAAIAGIIRLWNPNCTTVEQPISTQTVDNSALGTVTTTMTNYRSVNVCGPNPHDQTSGSMLKYAGLIAAAGAASTIIGIIVSTHTRCE
jgi:hypothetical protein